MKAIRLHARGGAEQIVYEDAPNPVLLPGDVLVKVLASGITRDELLWGPTYTDENGKDRTPSIPGHELCGVIRELGPGVTDLIIGDTVYGLTSFFRDGTAAELIAVHAADLAPKPTTLDAIQTAAVPLAALTAWQALFDHGNLIAGQKILVHGAAGSVGTFAVQMAAWCGAQVIGTASAGNLDLVRSLGAIDVIDYKSGSFARYAKQLDLVLDTVGGESRDRSWELLRPGGILVSIAGEGEFLQEPLPVKDVRATFFIVKPDRPQLIRIAALIDQGMIKPVIAGTLPLQQARLAFERKGKIVLYM